MTDRARSTLQNFSLDGAPPDLAGRGILVVDDEESMRELLEIMLQTQGFHVYAAADGAEALEVFETHRENIWRRDNGYPNAAPPSPVPF